MKKPNKKKVCGYIKGRRSTLREERPYTLRITKKLRAQVNTKLREFLDSDSCRMELMFTGDIVPHRVSRALINVKTCSNCWSQYALALFDGWPDLISKKLGNYSSHVCSDDVVMKNEVLGDNYSISEHIPMGYKVKP